MSDTDLEYTFFEQISGITPRNWAQSKRAEQAQTRRDSALAENAAAERRGYMLALERLQAMSDDPKAPLDDMQRDGVLWALIEPKCQAPGEAE